MEMIVRCVLCAVIWSGATHFARAGGASPADDIAHIREELGVNAFTAPSIELLFGELRSLQPIPFDKVWRELPDRTPRDRARLALCAGQTIAAGFLAVGAEKQSRIEPVGRVLLKLARGLGVGDYVTRHSKLLIELAARSQWAEMRQELVRAQADVERGMMALKDEEIAHLVSLGGWLRGLEIVTTVVLDDYQPDRARRLIQPALVDYYLDRVATLNPALKETALFVSINKTLAELAKLNVQSSQTGPSEAEVKRIRDLVRELNRTIASPDL